MSKFRGVFINDFPEFDTYGKTQAQREVVDAQLRKIFLDEQKLPLNPDVADEPVYYSEYTRRAAEKQDKAERKISDKREANYRETLIKAREAERQPQTPEQIEFAEAQKQKEAERAAKEAEKTANNSSSAPSEGEIEVEPVGALKEAVESKKGKAK